jgi:predicted phosphate transport protein (TIGR00153 family)
MFPPSADFYGLLLAHADKVYEGVRAFHDYAETGKHELAERVRTIEKEADEMRRDLRHEVFRAFGTPIDREDLFYLSRRLDEVINYVKHSVRDMQVLSTRPAPVIHEITAVLVRGTDDLVEAIRRLPQQDEACGKAARAAKNAENEIAKLYPRCLKSLYDLDDVKEILKQTEILRSLTSIANRIDEVADVILHIVVKES